MTKEINWEEVRINASISIFNALLETTQHSVIESAAIKDVYAETAVAYADTLIKVLKKKKEILTQVVEDL